MLIWQDPSQGITCVHTGTKYQCAFKRHFQGGDIVKVILPNVASNTNTRVEIDEEASGYYLIKNLRHHFEKGKATTSMTVIRDSYGL